FLEAPRAGKAPAVQSSREATTIFMSVQFDSRLSKGVAEIQAYNIGSIISAGLVRSAPIKLVGQACGEIFSKGSPQAQTCSISFEGFSAKFQLRAMFVVHVGAQIHVAHDFPVRMQAG